MTRVVEVEAGAAIAAGIRVRGGDDGKLVVAAANESALGLSVTAAADGERASVLLHARS